jgi:predicted N-acetyltransferase YhbS
MNTITVRPAEDSDNEQIMQLSRRCYQDGIISLSVQRTPRFNSLHRLLDPDSWHYVACLGSEVIGLVGVVHFPAVLAGTHCTLSFMMDLRVDPRYRKGRTAFRLVQAAIDHVLATEADMVIANFLKRNRNSLIFASGRAGIPKAFHLGDNRVFNMLPLRTMQPDPRFEIGVPSPADIPELLALYRNYASGFRMAPVMGESRFELYLGTVDGLSLDRFIVAREGGKIRAVTALWDEHTYKSYEVLKLTYGIRAVSILLRFLSLFMKTPKPVRLHEPLRQLSLVMYAHDDCPGALGALFRHVNNTYRGSDYTLITLQAQERDPLFRLLRPFTGISVKSEMYLFSRDGAVYEKLARDGSPDLPDLVLTL